MDRNTILIVGSRLHSDGYPRNQEIIRTLQALGWEIRWCALAYPRSFHKLNLFLRLGFIVVYTPIRWLYAILYSILLRSTFRASYVYVPFPAHLDIPVAWLIARLNGARLVADIFLSIYNTLIQDRKISSEKSLIARTIFLMEKLLLRLPDSGLIDTPEHKVLLTKLYGEAAGHLDVVPISIDESLFTFCPPVESDKVIFWGTYIKLHGVDTIIRAAALVQKVQPEIQFEMIGVGQELARAKALAHELEASNILFVEAILAAEELIERSRSAFCALGIFGESDKSRSVFPYKAVQALALGVPLITAKTDASSGLLTHNHSAILTSPGNAEALAEAIVSLYVDKQLGQVLAHNGRAVYENNFSRQQIKLAIREVFKND